MRGDKYKVGFWIIILFLGLFAMCGCTFEGVVIQNGHIDCEPTVKIKDLKTGKERWYFNDEYNPVYAGDTVEVTRVWK